MSRLCALALVLLSLCPASLVLAESPPIPQYQYTLSDHPSCLSPSSDLATDYGFAVDSDCPNTTLTFRSLDAMAPTDQVFALGDDAEQLFINHEIYGIDDYTYEWTMEQEQDGELVLMDSGTMRVLYGPEVFNEGGTSSGGLPPFLGCSATGTQGPGDFSMVGVLLLMAGCVGARRRRAL